MGLLSGRRLIILKLDLLLSTEKATQLREATNPMTGGPSLFPSASAVSSINI
jgi:hypothetical protein